MYVRSKSFIGGGNGNQYDLAGNFIGGLGNANPGIDSGYDGATDGTRSWTVGHNDGPSNFGVFQGALDLGGAGFVFSPVNRASGIAYDGTDNTLWLTRNVGGSNGVDHYDLAGNMLGTFAIDPAIANGGGYGLALDPADQTLWITGAFTTAGTLWQYDKSGNLMSTVSVSGLSGFNAISAEFAAVPEPFSMIALGLGALALVRRRQSQ